MTTQEAYEIMRVYLGRPGARQAQGCDDACRYETAIEGEIHRCAVGCLLGPETLKQTKLITMEFADAVGTHQGGRVVALADFVGDATHLSEVGYVVPELDDVDEAFLIKAQSLHDSATSWSDGRFDIDKLDALARDFGLDVIASPVTDPEREAVIA